MKEFTFIQATQTSLIVWLLASGAVQAQIVPDSTLPVNASITTDHNISTINGGTRAASNLFHSFEQFSVPTGNTAYFNNTLDIQNIISRVTGGSISNVDGLLRANGSANLFLLNPNGIVFGPNATLNVGGSFLASTASSLTFADGTQFSATATQTTPLLTISVPIGLQFGSNPGAIRVQGLGHGLAIPSFFSPILGAGASSNGLRVLPGKTLALVGGDIVLEGGILTAPGGRVELGSVGNGVVSIDPTALGWVLGYQGVQNFQDIRLSQRALLDASGSGSNSIQLAGKQISFADGSVALIQNQGSQFGGGVNVQASDSFQLSGASSDGAFPSGVELETLGGSVGDVVISSKHLTFESGAAINSKTFTQANASNIILNASESIIIKGFSFINPTITTIASGVGAYTFSRGKSGNIAINTEQLTILDGGTVTSGSFGTGDGGDLIINANRSVEVSGFNPFLGLPSQVSVATYVFGNSGSLTITAPKIRLYNGGVINSYTFSSGNAGNIAIKAPDFIAIEAPDSGDTTTPTSPGDPSYALLSGVASYAVLPPPSIQQVLRLSPNLSGAAGNIKIETGKLSVSQGSITVSNLGTGPAGNLDIVADTVSLKNNSSIAAATAFGNGGNILLQARQLQVRDNSTISAAASNPQTAYSLLGIDFPYSLAPSGTGNGGNITIDTDTLVAQENSDITADAFEGRGGNIQINTQGLFRSPDSVIRASSGRGPQFDGIVQVNTPDIDFTKATVQPVAGPESPEIASVCQGRSNTVANELIDTGTGGVPASPSSPLSSVTGWQDNSLPNQVTKNFKELEQLTAAKPTQIVEAQGWKRNAFGTVSMITDTSGVVLYSSLATPSCLKASPIPIQEGQNESRDTVKVQRFLFKGNRAFSTKQLEAVVAPYKRRKITFTQLLQARAAVTKFYTEAGYITSGALIPIKENQEIQLNKGAVTIQVVEGTLEKINVSGSDRLQGYVRSRLKSAGSPALNRNRLEEALRLLQADPKIASISANLVSSSWIDKTLLEVDVKAKQSFRVETSIDNERSPAVGSLQRRAQITQSNLLGVGDELNLGYRNTDGSDALQTSYTLPINSRNGTLQFSYADISSGVVEQPFNELDIISDSRSYELSLRQPLLQKASSTSTKEFALGVSASRQESESSLAGEPYPLSLGADDQGRTRISSVRFFQDWTQRSGREVVFARSQFSLGVGALDATINAKAPDSRFFAWRGQALWLRRLAENTTLLLRADLQLADTSLVPLEQFSLGGATTVRGYRQDALLGDSGFLISAELRIPIISSKSADFHIIPFIDMGFVWNDSDRESEITDTLDDDTLASVGLGLQYQVGDRLTARLDWGIPLNDFPNSNNSTWQENGLHFSLRYQPPL